MTKLAEGVKALRVDSEDLGASSAGHGAERSRLSPAADKDTLPDSPDYNDINFWRPNPFWFDAD